MSASLVGSEMCIRDSSGRLSREGRLTGFTNNRVMLMVKVEVALTLVEEAVSYTHLTLPTICSV
eukprot:305055-Alexandrium_andersonii.AAC.1